MLSLLQSAVEVHIQRGELEARASVLSMFSRLEESSDLQELSSYLGSRAALHRAEGRFAEALADARGDLEAGLRMSDVSGAVRQAGHRRGARGGPCARGGSEGRGAPRSRSRAFPPGTRPPFLDAQANAVPARASSGDPSGFEAAAAAFREVGLPFWLAVALLEHGELDGRRGARSARRARSSRSCERRPWLERLGAAALTRAEVPA